MKIALYTLAFVAVIAGGCGSKENAGSGTPEDRSATDTGTSLQEATGASDSTGGITMTVSPDRFNAKAVGEARLNIANHGETEITLGEPYTVEYNNGGRWEKVTLFDNILFTMIAHSIAAGEARDFPINLQPMPYDYKPGQYRLLKDVNAGDKKIILSAAFSVE